MDDALETILAGFEAWLREQDYADSSIQTSLTDGRQLLRCLDAGEDPPRRLWAVARRLEKFFEAVGEDASATLGPAFAHLLERATVTAAERDRRTRKRDARSVPDEDWRTLYQAICDDDTLEAAVLGVQMVTGLRIGDVFRFKRSAVSQALRDGLFRFTQKGRKQRTYHVRGPLKPALERLLEHWPKGAANVLEALASSGVYSTAYNRVDRHFKKIAAGALPGRAHTHRLRRTFAMQTWRTTKDLRVVQQILGHKSMRTTERYLDEEQQPDEIAELHVEVHDRFLGGES